MNDLVLSTVERALTLAGLWRADATLLLALSGGADSTALLYALCALRQRVGFTVRAAHVEHGLRGEASLRDAAFCEALCARLAVPFVCLHAELDGGMDAAGAEERAREARYALLLKQATDCDALLLAQHRDDQAETVLMRLLRGSGARGLSAMRPVSQRDGVTLVRPLLALSKQSLLDALDGAPYCTDESNARPVCQRNRLRQDVLPLLTRENPRAIEHMAQTAALLAMDEDCLQRQADTLLERALFKSPPFFCARRDFLRKSQAALAIRALRRFAEAGASLAGIAADEHALSAEDSLRLLRLLSAPDGSSLNLPHGLTAFAGARYLHLLADDGRRPLVSVPPMPPLSALVDVGELRFGSLVLRHTTFDPLLDPAPDGLRTVVLPVDRLARCAFRWPQSGDVLRPFGASGGKPLRRYLTDRKVDAPFRPYLPVLADGDTILWIVGLGASEATRVTAAPSLRIEALGALPAWRGGAD